jgi:hypothetical protein
MFGLLRTPFERHEQPSSHHASRRKGRPGLEELESRSVPSVTNVGLLYANIRVELTAARSDMQAISIPNATPNVKTDISNLDGDINQIGADLTAHRDPTGDVNTALTDFARLRADLGTSVGTNVQSKVQDVGTRLEIVAKDVYQIKAALNNHGLTAARRP